MKFLLEILSTFYATGFTGPHRDNKRTKMIEILPTKCHFLLKEREKVSFLFKFSMKSQDILPNENTLRAFYRP